MNRLTRKVDYCQCENRYQYDFWGDLLEESADKLGQLEDIEEELGVDLITLFKALKNGIYIRRIGNFKNGNFNVIEHTYFTLPDETDDGWIFAYNFNYSPYSYKLKDYGKTKEELE